MTLAWTASTVPEAGDCETSYPLDGYTVWRADNDSVVLLANTEAGTTSFTDDSADFGASYTYRVAARNAAGTSPRTETTVTVPAQPVLPATGLTASIADPFDGNVSLSWNTPTGGPAIAGYMVFRYDGTSEPFAGTQEPVTLAESAAGTALTDDTAQAGVTYSYVVIAHSADNMSGPSNTAVIEPPAPVTGVTAAAMDGAINLTWAAPAAGTAVEYRVERRQDGAWETLTDTAETSHSDDTAQANVEYQYRVQHRNQYGGSAWTESQAVTMVAVPGKPTGLVVTAEGDDNVLSWTAPDSPVIDGYTVEHRESGGDWAELATGLTGTQYRHEDTPADVLHEYRVQAYNPAGNGAWSDVESAMRITPAKTPLNVSATLEGADIVLIWERPDSVHISGYTVRHAEGEGDYTLSDRLSESQTSYRISDVSSDVVHRLGVQAHNDGGDSPWSADAEITRVLPPGVPSNVTAVAGNVNITVSWSVPATGTVSGYHVEYGHEDSDERDTAELGADANSFVHPNSTEGVTYQYRVRAHNTAGNGPWSTPVTAKRLLVPGTPTGVAATVSGGVIVVSWTAPETGIVAFYDVRYGVKDSGTTATGSVAGTEIEFVHNDPQSDTTYTYELRSRNDAGESPWTAPVEAIRVLPPTAPTGVTTAIDGDDILVSWTAPDTGIVGGYQIEHRQQNREESWTRSETGPGATSFTHVSPDPGTVYEYRVRTFNDGGVSDWTEPATGLWYEGAAPPAQIFVQNYGSRLLIQWAQSVTPGVDGYQLRHRIDGGDWNEETLSRNLHFVNWSQDQDLHEYSMRAMIGTVTGDWSPSQRVVIAQPGAVTNLSINREGANGVRLHWDAPSTGQPRLYRIQVDSGFGFRNDDVASGYATTHRVNHQPDGTTHRYRVLARNHVGITGAASNEVSLTTPAEPQEFDEIPTNVDARIVDQTTVKLTWNAPERETDRVTGYRIYRKLVSDTTRIGDSFRDHVLVRQTGSTATSFTDHTAEAGVLYEYAIAAYRASLNPQYTGVSPARAYARTWE